LLAAIACGDDEPTVQGSWANCADPNCAALIDEGVLLAPGGMLFHTRVDTTKPLAMTTYCRAVAEGIGHWSISRDQLLLAEDTVPARPSQVWVAVLNGDRMTLEKDDGDFVIMQRLGEDESTGDCP